MKLYSAVLMLGILAFATAASAKPIDLYQRTFLIPSDAYNIKITSLQQKTVVVESTTEAIPGCVNHPFYGNVCDREVVKTAELIELTAQYTIDNISGAFPFSTSTKYIRTYFNPSDLSSDALQQAAQDIGSLVVAPVTTIEPTIDYDLSTICRRAMDPGTCHEVIITKDVAVPHLSVTLGLR